MFLAWLVLSSATAVPTVELTAISEVRTWFGDLGFDLEDLNRRPVDAMCLRAEGRTTMEEKRRVRRQVFKRAIPPTGHHREVILTIENPDGTLEQIGLYQLRVAYAEQGLRVLEQRAVDRESPCSSFGHRTWREPLGWTPPSGWLDGEYPPDALEALHRAIEDRLITLPPPNRPPAKGERQLYLEYAGPVSDWYDDETCWHGYRPHIWSPALWRRLDAGQSIEPLLHHEVTSCTLGVAPTRPVSRRRMTWVGKQQELVVHEVVGLSGGKVRIESTRLFVDAQGNRSVMDAVSEEGGFPPEAQLWALVPWLEPVTWSGATFAREGADKRAKPELVVRSVEAQVDDLPFGQFGLRPDAL